MRSYIYSTVFLIALALVMWSLPMDVMAAADKATEKAADAPGHIFDKDDSVEEKRRKLDDYLRGRYQVAAPAGSRASISTSYRKDGSIEKVRMRGDFTPPGVVIEEEGDEYFRAVARAFIDTERMLIDVDNPALEIGGGEEISRSPSASGSTLRNIRYGIDVHGLGVAGTYFRFVFNDKEPFKVVLSFSPITPEMVAAAKRFKTEGLTEEDIKELVKADLVKRGVPREDFNETNRGRYRVEFFGYINNIVLTNEEPYVEWNLDVHPAEHGYDFGSWRYRLNAITGELIDRYSLASDDSEDYDPDE